jgi:hypothetical protein
VVFFFATTMVATTPNYQETNFEYKDLTRIHGEPTFEALKTLSKELKANAQSVYSNLGGGQHGHLGIVLTPAAYGLISNTPYETPTHPGQMTIPPGTTQVVA